MGFKKKAQNAVNKVTCSESLNALNTYCQSVNPLSGQSTIEPTAIRTILRDGRFNWSQSMPRGPFSTYTALGAILHLVRIHNQPAIQALEQLAQRDEIDWHAPHHPEHMPAIQFLAVIAIDSQPALNAFMKVTTERHIDLKTKMISPDLKGATFFFAIMQALARGLTIQSMYFSNFAEQGWARDKFNWNESIGQDAVTRQRPFPQTPVFSLALSCAHGDERAFQVLSSIVASRPQDLDWLQFDNPHIREYEDLVLLNDITFRDISTQSDKNKWRPFARLIESAIKYSDGREVLYRVLTLLKDKAGFKPYCDKVIQGFAAADIIALFEAAAQDMQELLLHTNEALYAGCITRTLEAVHLLYGYVININGYQNADIIMSRFQGNPPPFATNATITQAKPQPSAPLDSYMQHNPPPTYRPSSSRGFAGNTTSASEFVQQPLKASGNRPPH